MISSNPTRLKRYTVLLVLLWSLLVMGALGLALMSFSGDTFEMARHHARAVFETDLVYRQWVAERGGVYSIVSEKTPPNPYLSHMEERDITTPSGRLLTLVNPAYMTRQVHEMSARRYNRKSHLTSLKLINPANAPDPWEREALMKFDDGASEVSSVVDFEGSKHLRLMRPEPIKEACLKCHGYQGYKVGDVGGGISITVPLEPFYAIVNPRMVSYEVGFIVLWLMGLAGIAFGTRRMDEREEARKALKDSEELYRTLVENLDLGITLLDSDFNIIMLNQAQREMVNQPTRDLVGKKCFEQYPDQDGSCSNCTGKNTLAGGKPDESESEIIKDDGSIVTVKVRTLPARVENGKVIQFMHIAEDITERKRTEEALEKAKEEAEAASEAKSSFVANMSHEIRTPMNAIIGLSDLALKTELTAKQLDYLKKIKASGSSLLIILNDILDFSKIEAGKLELSFTDFDLETILYDLANVISLKAEEKGLELLFDIGSDVPNKLTGDPIRLGQVLMNLASNAVKFTDIGYVYLKVEKSEQDDEIQDKVRLKFSVEDTGIGLASEDIKNIFKSFHQAEGDGLRNYGGTGLGLTISNSLAEMMGGEITVTSEHGKGSTFAFEAEFDVQKDVKKKARFLLEDLKGERVLVVDDNNRALEILKEILTSLSFDVTLAASGKDAITILERSSENSPFKLVLMDYKMPDMDGIETTKIIKENKNISHIPAVLMVTAYGGEEVRKRAEKAGVDAFITKPVTPSLLYNTLIEVLDKKDGEKPQLTAKEKFEIEGLDEIRGARILLVEDNEINQQVARENLETEEFIVNTADNGKIAVEELLGTDAAEYDLVLMDLQMPEMDGYEATSIIRENSLFKDLPIIAMTAHAMKGVREQCLEAGMNDYLSKPLDPKSLFECLVKWIEPGEREIPGIHKKESDSEKADILPDNLDGLDIVSALKTIGGNVKLFKSIIAKFFKNYKNLPESIGNKFEDGDYEDVRRTAHTLKGVSGNIGAGKLYEISSALESALSKKKYDKSKGLLDDFNVELKIVLESAGKVVEKESEQTVRVEAKTTPIDLDVLSPLIDEINELLEKGSSNVDECMASIRKQLSGSEFNDHLERIENYLGNYDFEKAQEIINEVAQRLNIK